ncbi:hypothetical protein GF338_10045, partial [candidate division WOR-3 bacterium]|nr:hypothetical protein [candidate division WOR-3 bacterium]
MSRKVELTEEQKKKIMDILDEDVERYTWNQLLEAIGMEGVNKGDLTWDTMAFIVDDYWECQNCGIIYPNGKKQSWILGTCTECEPIIADNSKKIFVDFHNHLASDHVRDKVKKLFSTWKVENVHTVKLEFSADSTDVYEPLFVSKDGKKDGARFFIDTGGFKLKVISCLFANPAGAVD